jgi:SAM-dependent methyltransferase
MQVTGERVSTPAGGFNPTWQRHVAAYGLCAPLLPVGRVLAVGCGVGHSFELLAPRETVGLDVDPAVLRGQDRETRVGDMRALPFPDADFDAVISVQAIEHVPDPPRAVAEARRVLRLGGTAIFVTPNRLTFGPPDEVIDPYHFVEFSSDELRSLCEREFERVEMRGLFGSPGYLEIVAAEKVSLDRLLRLDPLRLRRLVPRSLRRRFYDRGLRRRRRSPDTQAEQIEVSDFELRSAPLAEALDLVAICHRPS